MSAVSLDARAQDRISRLPSAYKQLVNLIRRDQPDDECARQLAERKMLFHPTERISVPQAVMTVANIIGVPEGSYEERREMVRLLGIEFFGGAGAVASIAKRNATGSASGLAAQGREIKLVSALPTARELAERIAALSPRDRNRLTVGCDESLMHVQRARKLNMSQSSLLIVLGRLYSQLGIKAAKGVLDPESRAKLLREALALLVESA
jgi:hypothetical protein